MIAVITGTHPRYRFDRLLDALQVIAKSNPGERIVLQGPHAEGSTHNLETVGILGRDEILSICRDARAVLIHGGTGALALSRAAGHTPILVPRDPRHGEVIDAHQLEFAKHLAEAQCAVVCWDPWDLPQDLESYIAAAEAIPVPSCESAHRAHHVVENINRIISQDQCTPSVEIET